MDIELRLAANSVLQINRATGFNHIKMDPKDSHKTAFSTPHGHYEFDRMPFGLKTAPATFRQLMDLTLTGLVRTELFVYLDDSYIGLATKSFRFFPLDDSSLSKSFLSIENYRPYMLFHS